MMDPMADMLKDLAKGLGKARPRGPREYPGAVPGSRAEGRGESSLRRTRCAWYGQVANPYYRSDNGEPPTEGIGPFRKRRRALKHCADGLLPIMVLTSARLNA